MTSRDIIRLAGRPRRFARADGLALRRAMSDRLLPALVAAMTFLAALALAGAVGAALLAQRWSNGAASVLTIQVPDGDKPAVSGPSGQTRQTAALTILGNDQAIAGANALDSGRLQTLLAPWIGTGPYKPETKDAVPSDAPANVAGEQAAPPPSALTLPTVIQARLKRGAAAPSDLDQRLATVAPGTLVERSESWTDRLVALTTSLQACAGVALVVVAGVSVGVVAAATRAGLAARRHSIEIVHGLGASDGYIAGRFARRTTGMALTGGIVGTLLSIPLLLVLCRLGAPFAGRLASEGPPFSAGFAVWFADAFSRVPFPLWIALPLLPAVSACIGWGTAQATVRAWLRRLP